MQASDIPAKFNIPFGNNAGAGFIRSIPQASQIGITAGAASLFDGFPPVCFTPVGAGGTPPFGQDANGILFEATSWDRWLSAGGPIAYDGTFQAAIGGYPKGVQLASATSFGVWWLSTADNNVTNPDSAGAGWVQITPINLYAVDTGTANTYVCAFIPALLARVVGLPIKVKIANGNSGPSTLDDGLGAIAIVRRDGSALIGGELVTGRVATLIWNGTAYEWSGLAPATAAAILAATDTQSAVTPAQLNPGVSLAVPGYAKLPNGLIIQWGSVSVTSPSTTTITLPIAFPNAGFIGLATMIAGVSAVIGVVNLTTTTFQLTTQSVAGGIAVQWMVLGH